MRKLLFILLVSCLCLSSCAPKNVPSFEEYKKNNPGADRVDWDWEYGDLMYHADGRLRDQNLKDGYSAEQAYWVLAMALWGVFFVWAGMLTRTFIGFIFVQVVGIILALYVFTF